MNLVYSVVVDDVNDDVYVYLEYVINIEHLSLSLSFSLSLSELSDFILKI